MAEDRDGFDRDSNRFLEDSQRSTKKTLEYDQYWSKTTEKVPKWPFKDNGREILPEKFCWRKNYKKKYYLNHSGKILDDYDPKKFHEIWVIEL